VLDSEGVILGGGSNETSVVKKSDDVEISTSALLIS